MLRSGPMQGSFFRGVPCQLSSKFRNSVARRVFWSRIARCAGDASQSINPTPHSATQERGSGLTPLPRLPPLPSRNDGRDSSYGRYKPIGTRSVPSSPSIPGKFSKYSKPISRLHTAVSKRIDKKAFRKPMGDIAARPDPNLKTFESSAAEDEDDASSDKPENIPPKDKIPDWMQKYQYSYSEVPPVPIVGFRVTPWSPFGPEDLAARPWTGSAPLKPSKKKRIEFDSFNPPPLNKKGVKYVQRPGPFPPGEGPRPGKTREEILGAPLSPLEIKEIVEGCNKRSKQLNLGRDGLTHNMLDLVHNHWKRSVCCKIKCKGVPTVDLDNVARVIEEKTGGIIIYRAGGVMYVFRGRNYNFKDRPKIPIMLWKPPAPIYPKLIQAVPEGFTLEEVTALRAAGRRVAPLVKLSKNGVYMTLVADVRAQFRVDEVVRVDCTGLNPSDYKKIGAKLKELVPCVLLSFEKEQIIVCSCKVSEPPEVEKVENAEPAIEGEERSVDTSNDLSHKTGGTGQVQGSNECEQDFILAEDVSSVMRGTITDGSFAVSGVMEEATLVADGNTYTSTSATVPNKDDVASGMDDVDDLWQRAIDDGKALMLDNQIAYLQDTGSTVHDTSGSSKTAGSAGLLVTDDAVEGSNEHEQNLISAEDMSSVMGGATTYGSFSVEGFTKEATLVADGNTYTSTSATVHKKGHTAKVMDDVDDLWEKAIDEGRALQLDNEIADLDVVFEKAAELSEVFTSEEKLTGNLEVTKIQESKIPEVPTTSPFDVPPMGGLRVDELAKLLAP